MNFNLEGESAEFKEEFEKYDREAEEYIENKRSEGRERRKKSDNIFRDIMLGIIVIGVIICFAVQIL